MGLALIVGSRGQLGQELIANKPVEFESVTADRSVMDISDRGMVFRVVERVCPTVILNAAGYTAVDLAESDVNNAQRVNALGPVFLTEAAMTVGARLIHVSTNYVFDGSNAVPLLTTTSPRPLSQYGRSKLDGEEGIRALKYDLASIVRAGWLYSARGNNFVTRMLKLMCQRKEINVVDDQVGTPTLAAGLADAMWRTAQLPTMRPLWHWADSGQATWYEFALVVYEEGRKLGLISNPVRINPISTKEFTVPAPRPHYAVLDASDTYKVLGIHPPNWRDALAEEISRIDPQQLLC